MSPAAALVPLTQGGEGGMPSFTVTTLDLSVIIGYLLLSRIIPLVASSRMKKKAKASGKETEESGVLVQKEDAQDQTDAEVQKPEKEPEPKDVNNTLEKDEGKGLF